MSWDYIQRSHKFPTAAQVKPLTAAITKPPPTISLLAVIDILPSYAPLTIGRVLNDPDVELTLDRPRPRQNYHVIIFFAERVLEMWIGREGGVFRFWDSRKK